jgi:tetraacyldisaccharide 4'-kinase
VDFADHYAYTDADIQSLLQQAKSLGAALVTTEKDFVKLSPTMQKQVYCLKIRTVWTE